MGLFGKKRAAVTPVSAVIVAAGSASRMEGIDKQQFLIDEIPVVVRSIQEISRSPLVHEVVLVCREELIADYYALVQDFGLDKVSSVVAGGRERQDSVFSGVNACRGDAAFFAIHDGARPLVTADVVDCCIRAAFQYGAAAAGVKSKDTMKITAPDGSIVSTPDRESLYAIQTPQVFEAGLYRQAMEFAVKTGRSYTDDCQLVEQLGRRVYVAQGSYENIKITTLEDIALAQAILAFREGGLELWG